MNKSIDDLLRVGIIGAGAVAAEIHAPGYAAAPHAEIVAVASATRASAERLAERFSIPAVHADAGTLLDDPAVDAVSICSPPATHRQLVEAAVAAGKHVLVEKPIGPTLADVEAIRKAAESSERTVEVVRNERFMEFNLQVRDALAQGAVGELLGILQSTSISGPEVWAPSATWHREPAAGGGALIDLGVHKADLAAWLADQPLLEASVTVMRDGDAEQHGLLSLELANGVLCAVEASWAGPPDQASIIVTGTAGVLTGVWSTGEIVCHGANDARWTTAVPWSSQDRSDAMMIAAFVETCRAGERPVFTDQTWDLGTRAVLLGYAAGARRLDHNQATIVGSATA